MKKFTGKIIINGETFITNDESEYNKVLTSVSNGLSLTDAIKDDQTPPVKPLLSIKEIVDNFDTDIVDFLKKYKIRFSKKGNRITFVDRTPFESAVSDEYYRYATYGVNNICKRLQRYIDKAETYVVSIGYLRQYLKSDGFASALKDPDYIGEHINFEIEFETRQDLLEFVHCAKDRIGIEAIEE